MPWRAQNQQIDWLAQKKLKNKARTQKFSWSESKIRQNEKKEILQTKLFFCDFSFSILFSLPLSLLTFSLLLLIFLLFFLLRRRISLLRFCLHFILLHCALSYLSLIVSSPWNVLLTFSVFFSFSLYSLSLSFTMARYFSCVRCTSQHKQIHTVKY